MAKPQRKIILAMRRKLLRKSAQSGRKSESKYFQKSRKDRKEISPAVLQREAAVRSIGGCSAVLRKDIYKPAY
jgi:hypothetical protein